MKKTFTESTNLTESNQHFPVGHGLYPEGKIIETIYDRDDKKSVKNKRLDGELISET